MGGFLATHDPAHGQKRPQSLSAGYCVNLICEMSLTRTSLTTVPSKKVSVVLPSETARRAEEDVRCVHRGRGELDHVAGVVAEPGDRDVRAGAADELYVAAPPLQTGGHGAGLLQRQTQRREAGLTGSGILTSRARRFLPGSHTKGRRSLIWIILQRMAQYHSAAIFRYDGLSTACRAPSPALVVPRRFAYAVVVSSPGGSPKSCGAQRARG